jgi:hypothetical protein
MEAKVHEEECKEKDICNKIDYDLKVLDWWDERKTKKPSHQHVAKTSHDMLPGSGKLKLDIGAFKNVITPKRDSLSPGLVEVQMLLRINKELTTLNTMKIKQIGKKWKQQMSKRPEFPGDFF